MTKNEDVKWGAGLFVPEDKIIFEQEVGSGKYGRVFKAHVYGTEVAVKVPKDEPANQTKILQLFRGEAQALSHLQHENVCRWLGYSTKIDENGKEQLLLITEFLPGGNLQEVIEGIGSGRRPLSLFSRLRMARDIARGMIFVHENSLPDNLMLDEFGRLKIVDFGFAQLVPKQLTKGTRLGSFLWMAPEVMLRKPFNHQSDVYSFAVIFWSLVTGKDPYTDYQEQSPFIEDVGEKGHRPPLPDTVPSVQCLIRDCWDPEPAKRPTFLQVNDRLNSILIEVSCGDEFARAYWSKYHFSYDKVQWSVFCKTFSRFTSLQPPDDLPSPSLSSTSLPAHPSSAQLRLATVAALREFMTRSPEANKLAFEEFRRRDLMEKWTGLKSVLMEADPYTRAEIVHLERFGKVTSLFGPFHNPEAFFENIRSILRQRWFFGILSKDQAADSLRARPGLQTKPGTFLVRMSTNPLHDGVISLHTGRQIMHIEIQHVKGKGFHLLGKDQYFPGLKELVEHYIFQGLLKDPAPFAHPFRQFQDPADDSAPEVGYLLPKDFLIGEDPADQGIRDRLKNTPPLPNVERRQLGFSQDLISSPELSELITAARVPSSEEQAAEYRKRLKLRLELYGFREKPISNSPSSLFEAFSDQLYGNISHALRLRGEAVFWLKMNANLAWTNGLPVRQQVQHFEQYVQDMEKPTTPGDIFILQILATMNRVRVWVISSVPALQYVTEILPHPSVKNYQEKALVLAHHASNGFGSLQSIDEMEVDLNLQPDAAYRDFLQARGHLKTTESLDTLQRTMAIFERVARSLRYAELEAEKSADRKSHGLSHAEWRSRVAEVAHAKTELEKMLAFKLVGH